MQRQIHTDPRHIHLQTYKSSHKHIRHTEPRHAVNNSIAFLLNAASKGTIDPIYIYTYIKKHRRRHGDIQRHTNNAHLKGEVIKLHSGILAKHL